MRATVRIRLWTRNFCVFKNEGDFPGDPVAKTLHSQSTWGLNSIPGQGTRSHMPQLRPGAAKERNIYIYIIEGRKREKKSNSERTKCSHS